MATDALMIREPIDSDWPVLTALYNSDTEEPLTVAEFKRRYDMFPSAGRRLFLVAEGLRGLPVGMARASHRPGNGPGVYYADVTVAPEWRNRGYGSALYARIHDYLEAERARVTTFFVRESHDASMRFAERRGYTIDRVLAESSIDLTGFDLAAWEARLNPEIELLTLADLGDSEETWREAHRVSVESDDGPDIELWGVQSYEDFFEGNRNQDRFVRNGLIMARIGGEFAGIHTVWPVAGSDGWTTDYTGVLPAFRRRGVATALKVFGIRQALAAGAKWIMTHNDSSNEGMLAINRALGFQAKPGYAQMRKRVER